MKHMETLRAVFCFDENLTAQVQAAAASLLAASVKDNVIWEIHCVCTPAAGVVEEPLHGLLEKIDGRAALIMHCVENPFAGAYEVRGISAGTYLRLALPSLLPEIDRILYLDADVLVRQSLLPLWRTSLAGCVLAAVKGAVNLPEKWEWNSARPYWHLLAGMKGGYINAGVTLLNLDEARSRGLVKRWNELAEQKLYYQDQDILNITCQGAIAYLPPKYNRLAYLSDEDYGQFAAEGIFTEAACAEAQNNPVIIHYAGDKPWKRYDTNQGALWWDFVREYPALYALFDEEKARKYHGPTLVQRGLRKVQRVLGREKL